MTTDDPGALLTNARISAVLAEIADLLDIKGVSSFKVGAYRRAAESVARCPVDVAIAYRAGERPVLAGVGKTLAERIEELSLTGGLRYHDELREELPASLMTLLAIPGVGPRTVGDVWRELGIATLSELEAAGRAGKLRELKGISTRTEARIIAGIVELEQRPPKRLLMGHAHALAERVVALVEALPGAQSATVAGSVRRFRETVGDLDLLVETADGEAVVEALVATAAIEPATGEGRGDGAARATVQLRDGPRLDVMTMPPGVAGSYLVHFSGSAEHNVRLRQRARGLGWSLSEKGLRRIGDDGSAAEANDRTELRTFGTEAELYAFLGLRFIEPELREDNGEIEAAEADALPTLVSREDLRGDCHSHSHWSDGREPLELMVGSA
ncbi:MAG: helix-hairpin-helix domain-containing protein, partial [Chloroflexota bacterium]